MNNDVIRFNPDNVATYIDYINRRSDVYRNKNVIGSAAPWSEDPILQNYKFTNCKRYLDKETKFLIETVIDADLTVVDKIFNILWFRAHNISSATCSLGKWPLVISEINIDEIVNHEISLRGYYQTQSNAYFLSATRNATYRSDDHKYADQPASATVSHLLKHIDLIKEISKTVGDLRIGTERKCLDLINKLPGYGKFLAYQCWVDISYMKETWWDDDCLVESGPGCDRGIMWLLVSNNEHFIDFGENQNSLDYGKMWEHIKFHQPNLSTSFEDIMHFIRDNISKMAEIVHMTFDPKKIFDYLPEHQQKFTLMDIENSFCEFDKYMKKKLNIKCRTRYYP